ncbi:hypothetical protein SIID45300_01832 [Candidatus Magnetaquicoccaceae bacterium FCR-1]|uniref:Uncharacterized protein n=1 Tax=Candidatus Magnetaquiglobus chichijimensis TaxID=3141448 RepID=A0ABQ0C9E6_9PROT
MRALKFFVIFGAVLLLVGLGGLVVKLVERGATGVTTAAPVETGVPVVGEETLPLPPGARLVQVNGLDSSGVAVLVELPRGAGHQLLFFSSQGKLKRRVTLDPTPPRDPPSGSRNPDS